MSQESSLLCSFQLWTLKYAGLHEHDIAVHSYQAKPPTTKQSFLPFLHSSASKEKEKAIYYDEFNEYFNSRSLPIHLSNRIFQNLRDKLIEFDQLLSTLKLVRTIWLRSDVVFQIFSNGTFVFLHLDKTTRTLKHLTIDKTGLSKKCHIDAPIADFYLNTFGFYVIYENLSKIDLFYFTTPVKHFHSKFNLTNESFRLKSEELPPYSNEIPVRRSFHVDHDYRTLTVWWTMLAEGLSTTTVTQTIDGDQRRSKFNCLAIVFNSTNEKEREKIFSIQTETVNPFFCSATPSGLTTVEMNEDSSGPDRQYEISIYYYENFRSVPLRLVHVPKVYSTIQFVLRSSSHTIVCLMDSTLISIDEINHVQRSKRSALTRNLTGLWWIIENLLFALADGQGSIVFYDIALNPIWPVLSSFEKLHFQQQLHIDQSITAIHQPVNKQPMTSSNVTLLLQFSSSGPIGLMDLHYPFDTIHSLLKFYLNSQQYQSTVDLFWCIDWSRNDADARYALSYISQEFFRYLKTHQYILIEELLRTFYAPLRPISDASILRNRSFVNQIARKFFYILLREKSFSKALLLAKHLDDRQIYFDLFYASDANKERTVMNVCAEKLALNTEEEKEVDEDDDESGLSVTSDEDENESDRTVKQRYPPANNSIYGDINEIVTSAIEDYQLDETMYKYLLDRLHVS